MSDSFHINHYDEPLTRGSPTQNLGVMMSPTEPIDTESSYLESHANMSFRISGTLNTVFMQNELSRKLKRLRRMLDTVSKEQKTLGLKFEKILTFLG